MVISFMTLSSGLLRSIRCSRETHHAAAARRFPRMVLDVRSAAEVPELVLIYLGL
jgi:hypothetical protein